VICNSDKSPSALRFPSPSHGAQCDSVLFFGAPRSIISVSNQRRLRTKQTLRPFFFLSFFLSLFCFFAPFIPFSFFLYSSPRFYPPGSPAVNKNIMKDFGFKCSPRNFHLGGKGVRSVRLYILRLILNTTCMLQKSCRKYNITLFATTCIYIRI
jgi:hypothetical protein